jgi:hypothetical protein
LEAFLIFIAEKLNPVSLTMPFAGNPLFFHNLSQQIVVQIIELPIQIGSVHSSNPTLLNRVPGFCPAQIIVQIKIDLFIFPENRQGLGKVGVGVEDHKIAIHP